MTGVQTCALPISPTTAAPTTADTDAADTDAAALLGPLPAGTTLERVETHAEFRRYYLRADRAYVLEATPHREGTPVCTGGGVDLWVRLDLSEDAESFVWDPLPPVVTEACARLATHAPVFGPPLEHKTEYQAPLTDGAPWQPLPPWRWRPLHAVVIPFLALLVWLVPRDRTALAAGLLALAVRVGLSPTTVLLGGDAAYERLLRARGLWDPDPYYGETWPSLLGLLWKATGQPEPFVHAANIGFSALTVVFIVALARRVGASPFAAAAAGVLLAAHPLVVAVAGMEDLFVLVGLLQVVAVTYALGPLAAPAGPTSRAARAEPWAAALAVALLAHLRPEQAVFALVPLGLLAWRRAWGPLAVAVALCGWRWAEILGTAGAVNGGADLLGWSRWTNPGFLRQFLVLGPYNPALLLAPTRSPFALVVLVALGALGARHAATRRLAVPLAALVLPLLVVLPKTSPLADPVRFQLPGFAFAAVLAGVALAPFAGRVLPLLGWGAALLGTGYLARSPLGGGWAWAHEHLVLRAHVADMPADTLVYYRADQDPFHHFGIWADTVSPGKWRPLEMPLTNGIPLATGDWYWRGFADGAAGSWPPVPCAFEPITVTTVTSQTDGWIVLPPGPMTVGFYRVGGCE